MRSHFARSTVILHCMRRSERTLVGAEKALGLRFWLELEAAMDAGDDKVKTLQHIGRMVERAVGQNIRFDTLQGPEVLSKALVDAVRLLLLRVDPFLGQPLS
jgi:hypothetical protein